MYVQNVILEHAAEVFRILVHEEGHFYVCGDCTMAEDVLKTLKSIIQKYGNLDEGKVEKFLLKLRVSMNKLIICTYFDTRICFASISIFFSSAG